MEYKTGAAKRVISSAKEKKQKECARDVNDPEPKMKFCEWQSILY